jgi:hypothetical protein
MKRENIALKGDDKLNGLHARRCEQQQDTDAGREE